MMITARIAIPGNESGGRDPVPRLPSQSFLNPYMASNFSSPIPLVLPGIPISDNLIDIKLVKKEADRT